MTNTLPEIIKLSNVKQTTLQMALDHNRNKPYHDFIIPEIKIEQAVDLLAKNNYRYNNNTGDAYDNSGLVSHPTTYKEENKHASVNEIIKWEFIRVIINEAQRMIRQGKEYKY